MRLKTSNKSIASALQASAHFQHFGSLHLPPHLVWNQIYDFGQRSSKVDRRHVGECPISPRVGPWPFAGAAVSTTGDLIARKAMSLDKPINQGKPEEPSDPSYPILEYEKNCRKERRKQAGSKLQYILGRHCCDEQGAAQCPILCVFAFGDT